MIGSSLSSFWFETQGILLPCSIPWLQESHWISCVISTEMSFTSGVGNCYFSTSRVFFFSPAQAGKQFSFWVKKKIHCHCVSLTDRRTHISTLTEQSQWIQPDCWWPPESVHSEVYLQGSVSLLDVLEIALQVDCTLACLNNATEFSKPFYSTEFHVENFQWDTISYATDCIY